YYKGFPEQSTPVFNFCLFINERQGIRLRYYKGFPEQSTPVFNFCLFINERQGIRDCATINGHAESLVIRTLMKDAREILLR
ncbi:hypothetical protein R9R03_00190, partial [Escherichia coli]